MVEERDRQGFPGSLLRRDAGKYSRRWKIAYGATWLFLYCAFLVGVKYFAYGVPLGETLSSGNLYASALGTLVLIVFIYWFMTDRGSDSRQDS